MTHPYLSSLERVYQELATPKPDEAKPATVDIVKPLTRDDVTAIIARKRSATAEELEEIIGRAKELKLTDGERQQIALDCSIFSAQRARQVEGKRDDPNSKLIHDLGYAITPHGLLYERAWYQRELQTGTKAIAACRRHLPPDCACWKETRANLYSVRQSFNDRSPETWAAMRVWEALDEIEIASRPETGH
jgi:hypothetical protein